jgi:hypothetical protein
VLIVSALPQSIFFFLQQSIANIPFPGPENSGVPASTPPTSAKSRNRDVSHFFIFNLTILNKPKSCQELNTYSALFYSCSTVPYLTIESKTFRVNLVTSIAASATLTAQSFDAFFDNDRQHHERRDRISSPETEQCIQH